MRATQAGQSALLLLDVVDRLTENHIEYVVIGAMAASVHGVVRASLDADAVAFVSPDAARKLVDRLLDAGLAASLRVGDIDDPIAALLAVEDEHGNRADLLIGLRGLERSVLTRAIHVPFQGSSLVVLSREDFIATKLFAGGPQDLADARAAIAIDPGSVDRALLQKLADHFGRETRARLDLLLSTA